MKELLSKEQSESVKLIEELFIDYSNKARLLTNEFTYTEVNKETRNEIASQLFTFINDTKGKVIEQYCLIELQNEIIEFLENKIQELGGNKETVLKEFKESKSPIIGNNQTTY